MWHLTCFLGAASRALFRYFFFGGGGGEAFLQFILFFFLVVVLRFLLGFVVHVVLIGARSHCRCGGIYFLRRTRLLLVAILYIGHAHFFSDFGLPTKVSCVLLYL